MEQMTMQWEELANGTTDQGNKWSMEQLANEKTGHRIGQQQHRYIYMVKLANKMEPLVNRTIGQKYKWSMQWSNWPRE